MKIGTVEETKKQVHVLKAAGRTSRQIAKQLGISPSTVSAYANSEPQEAVDPTKKREFKETDEGAELSFITPHRIKTKEDAMKYGEIDPNEWAIKELKVNSWETVAKNERLEEDKNGKIWKMKTPKHYQLWAVSVKLAPVMPKPYLNAVKALIANVDPIRMAPLKRPAYKSDPVMMMFGLFDAHFGKRTWAPESGDDQDLKISERVYENAVTDLFARVSHLTPELIVWPVGNDFVHVDNSKGETTLGTYVGADTRHPKIISTAFKSQARGIARAAEVAPVRVLYIPGNHDEETTLYLALYLEAVFAGNPRVQVDMAPRSRKYLTYGETILGFTHGDKIKPDKLPGLLLAENRDVLVGTKRSEWFTGHNHRRMKYEDEIQGTVIHSLGALSATDLWHFDRGFVGARRAAEVYVYEKTGGYCGHWVASVRD